MLLDYLLIGDPITSCELLLAPSAACAQMDVFDKMMAALEAQTEAAMAEINQAHTEHSAWLGHEMAAAWAATTGSATCRPSQLFSPGAAASAASPGEWEGCRDCVREVMVKELCGAGACSVWAPLPNVFEFLGRVWRWTKVFVFVCLHVCVCVCARWCSAQYSSVHMHVSAYIAELWRKERP